MSPEQLEGAATDARSDIFSFGAVLYEMVAGRKAFDGTSRAGVIAAVLNHEVPPLSTVVPSASPALDRAVRKCLVKDPAGRWQSASDLASELRWIAEVESATHPAAEDVGPNEAAGVGHARNGRRRTSVGFLETPACAQRRPRRGGGAGLVLDRLAPGKDHPLHRRPLAKRPMDRICHRGDLDDGAEGAGAELGRDARAARHGRRPGSILVARQPFHRFWSAGQAQDGRRVWWTCHRACDFSSQGRHGGGEVRRGHVGHRWHHCVRAVPVRRAVSRFSIRRTGDGGYDDRRQRSGQRAHRWPQFLPDGRRFLFSIIGTDRSGLYVGSLDNPTQTPIADVGARALYVSPGYLLFTRGATLMAQPFDSRSLRLTGPPQRIVDRVATRPVDQGLAFSASDTGVLAYIAGDAATKRLVWYDRSGKQTGVYDASAGFNDPAFSPDETMVAASRPEADTNRQQLWLLDLRRSVASRFAIDASSHTMPLWSRDGKTLVFASGGDLYRQASDGSGQAELLLKSRGSEAASRLVFGWRTHRLCSRGSEDAVGHLAAAIVRRPPPETLPSDALQRVSRTYLSGWPLDRVRVGRVRAHGSLSAVVSVPGRKRLISTSGGVEPQWRRDGKELFYLSTDQPIMSVNITDPARDLSAPTPLFPVRVSGVARNHYLVTADGQRFLVSAVDDRTPTTITVALNWTSQLTQR